MKGGSSWGYSSSGGAKTTFCLVLLLQPLLPFTQTSPVPSSHCSLGSITGRKGDPCGVCNIHREAFGIQSDLFPYLCFTFR